MPAIFAKEFNINTDGFEAASYLNCILYKTPHNKITLTFIVCDDHKCSKVSISSPLRDIFSVWFPPIQTERPSRIGDLPLANPAFFL